MVAHLDDRLEVVLGHPVQLKRLPRRQPEVPVAVLPREVVQECVQLGSAHARRHLEPQHERVRLGYGNEETETGKGRR